MESSPIVDFYPINFETDLNGKQQDWEAVVLIPFIEEVSMPIILHASLLIQQALWLLCYMYV